MKKICKYSIILVTPLIVLAGCVQGFTNADRNEILLLRQEVNLLKDKLSAVKNDASTYINSNKVKANSEVMRLPVIVKAETPEQLMRLKIARNSFPISKNVISHIVPNAININHKGIMHKQNIVVIQRISFSSITMIYDQAEIEIDYKTEPPSLNGVKLIGRNGRDSKYYKLNKYALVERDI